MTVSFAGEEIKLDDSATVRAVGKFQVENLRVFFRLLETVTWSLVRCLRFDNGQH